MAQGSSQRTEHGSEAQPSLSNIRTASIVIVLGGLLFFGSSCSGIVVIALPTIQKSLGLQESLLVWPASSYYLAAGSCLMLAGSVADVVGHKRVNIAGSLLGALFALASGLAQTGGQIIAFRALQGVANAIVTPSSIAIISSNLPAGRSRNIAFGCLGLSQPLGFSFGLVVGGILADTVGWRPGFYLGGAASFALFCVSILALPTDQRRSSNESIWRRVATGIDWVGVILASFGLALLSYVLATLSADINNVHKASSIALLITSFASLPLFIWWMHHQVKAGRSALIPNTLWQSRAFTSCCIMVVLVNGLTNSMELYSSLFFQQVQQTSTLGASLRVLPSLVAGAAINLSTGIFVNRMPILWTVLIASVVSTVAPLLMALIPIHQLYWENAFVAQILSPISCDILFTVGLLVVSDVFPQDMQALSGALFNTCAQLGNSLGLSITQLIAASVTNKSRYADKTSADALMDGYRVAFWVMFGWMILCCLVCVIGLRRVGGVGVKRD